MFENDDENLNHMDYALKELDKDISNIFVYQDVKKFNKPVTIIQGLKDKDMIKSFYENWKKISVLEELIKMEWLFYKVIIKNM